MGLITCLLAPMQILSHSALYETAPAYVADQPSFFNAAILAHSDLAPLELLSVLKQVEREAGRNLTGGIRFGPRPLDLDIIFHGSERLSLNSNIPDAKGSEDTPLLQIPHPRWQERSFVKAPVSDLDLGLSSGPAMGPASVSSRLEEVSALWSSREGHHGGSSEPGEVMRRVLPLPRGRLMAWGGKTHLMAILNATPDSFSDGGQLMSSDLDPAGALDRAVSTARLRVQEGADILDIGGQSTRPSSSRVPEEEELARVIPLIRAIRQAHDLKDTVISVDTYSSRVAREAVSSGADIVNDVSGGRMDREMLPTIDDLQVPFVSMHMREDPGTMQSPENVSYPHGCTWRGVADELQQNVDRAVSAGIPAWALIVDPGLGFSKSAEGNIELIRHLGSIKGLMQGPLQRGPVLMGPSRKSFLGKILGRETQPSDRDSASIAASVACVSSGLVDIIRTHNVKCTADAIKVADAVFRERNMS